MRRLFSLLFCAVVTTAVFAQENSNPANCSNGIDDDGDGFIDCYDSDCALNNACDDIFIGNDATCTLTPPPAPAFTMQLDFSSANETTNHFSRVVIGDLNRDGMPEIVTMNKYTRNLVILNGSNGTIKHDTLLTGTADPEWELAIANINNDNCAEIFFLGTDSRIYVYDCKLNFLYSTNPMPDSDDMGTGGDDPINFGIADFDNDGLSEIYCKNQIFDAHSGRRLIASPTPSADWDNLNGGPVAVNMNADNRLELVIGLAIYQVNIPAGRGTDAGSLTLLNSRPEYFTRNVYNATSVADYNQDGFLDVIASGSTGCNGKNTTIFFWDVQNNTLRTYSDHNSINGDSDYERGWKNGTGRINIADLDGDGRLNLSYVSGGFLYALKEDLTRLWRVSINEETSGYTGCTLFDFNGDGKSEIVYRDERYLYIIDGTDGSIFNQQNCISRTNREYPIVADLDADGSTEICVTCGFDDALAWANFNTTNYSRYSHVRVFESAADPWVPARRVWNQHGYFVVNVNDDLTIPRVQQNHGKQFSTISCRVGEPVGPQRPLNKFLNQSPFIDTNGCPAYLAPDLDYATSITFTPPTCPDLNFQVQFTITNRGEVPITGSVPVSYYDSNPKKTGANKLATINYAINDLGRNQLFVVNQTINSNGSDSLFVVLNDAGTSIPVVLPNTPFLECNYDNFRGIAISPLPIALTAFDVTPNELCAFPPTGSAEAYVQVGATHNTADYNFYWFDGAAAGPIASADHTGPILSNIADGTYTVFAVHKTAKCSSDTTQVVVDPAPGVMPAVTVTLKSNQTNCNPPNGSLEATVGGPGGNSGYTFEWEDIAAPIGVSGPLLANQTSGTYTVIVTHTISGCQTSADGVIGDLTQEPDLTATATPVVDCTNPISGTVSATASVGGTAQPDGNYVFDWYFYDNATSTRGSLLPVIHGAIGSPDRTGLPIGYYEVEIRETATGCQGTSTQIVQVTDLRDVPTVTIADLAPQTSCDPASPNGRLQATSSVAGSTFEWFVGQNTLPANLHTSVSAGGTIAENVKGGGQSYTVKVTTPNHCTATEDDVVAELLVNPVVTLNSTPNGICDPAFATSPFTGTVTATVTFGGAPIALPNPNYSLKWYDGTTVVPAKERLADLNKSVLTQMDSGYYTVIVTRTDLKCPSLPETEFVNNTTILPVILTDADSSTTCIPVASGVTPNGRARVTKVDGLNPNPATHTFLWHDGIDTSVPLAAETNPLIQNLLGGVAEMYTVRVINRSNGCRNTRTVQIADASEKPIINLLPGDNSICDPAIAGTSRNGTMQVQTVTYKGLPFAGPLSYQWYNGVGTGSSNTTSTTALLSNLAAGFYSGTVTMTALGCTSDFDSDEVEDALILPVILTTPTPSTNCAGGTPNGSIAAAVDVLGVPTTTGYQFRWYAGTGTASQLPAPNNGVVPNAVQLQGGQDYTVEATNLSSGCKSTETLLLQDDKENPIITPLVFSPNLNCSAPFNGTAGVAAVPFTYRGTTITAPYTGFTLTWSGGTVNAAGDQISALAAGGYTLQVRAIAGNTVTNNNDNCISTFAPVTILDDFTYPVIGITETDQSSCDNTLPNGQLQATETSGSGSYTFDWYAGSGVGAPGTELAEVSDGLTTPVLDAGDYTVRVRNTSTRCESTRIETLSDHIVLPSLLLIAATPVTNCANPNGSTTATPTVTSTANGDFTIFYLKQNTTDPLLVKAGLSFTTSAAFTRSNLGPGFYASLIRDEITHCESQVITAEVQDLTDPADITIQGITDATFCNTADGAIRINVAGFSPFTFTWHRGGPTSMGPYDYIDDEDGTTTPTFNPDVAPFPITTEDLLNVGVGLYTVEVIDSRGCGTTFSESVPFQNPPGITVAHTNSTQCDVTAGDGTITTTVVGVGGARTYTVNIYLGLDLATAGAPISTTPLPNTGGIAAIASLNPGDYLIEITDNSIGCSMYKTQTIDVDALPPVVTLGVITPNSACDDTNFPDGAVPITIAKNAGDPRAAASMTFQIDNIINNTTSAPLAGPTFPIVFAAGSPVATTVNGFGAHQYTISITETSSGCTIDRVVTVPDQPVMPVMGQADVTITNDSFCAPNSNGSALVTNISPATIAAYEFSWFSDAALTTVVYQDNGGGATPNDGELFNANPAKGGYVLGGVGQGIGTRTYYVRGERLPGTGTGAGCPTPAVQVVIQDEHVTPIITLASLPNTSCDPAVGEGSISVTTVTTSPSAAVQNALYTYTSAFGVLPNQNGTVPTVYSQLTENGGTPYAFTALNQVSACPVNGNITVLPGQFDITVSNFIVNDKLICRLDGDITTTEITINRSLTSLPNQVFSTPLNANFQFRWFKNNPGSFTSGTPLTDGTPAVIATEGLVVGNGAGQYNDPAPTLGAGTYYVVARQLTGPGRFGANCETSPLRVEILDRSEDPIAALNPTTDTSCDGPFEGSINVNVTDASTVPGPFNYDYTWTALTVGRTPPGPVANPYNGVNNLFSLVEDGVYELTALNNVTGCSSIVAQTTVSKTAVPIVIASATHADQLICDPDGSITVVDITVNGTIDPAHNNFNFKWYKNAVVDGNEIVPFNPPSGNDILNTVDLPLTMGVGTYFVKAQRVLGLPFGSGCESAPLRIDILDLSEDPDLDFTTVKPDSSCNPLNPLGNIVALAAERDATTDNYTFEWTYNGGAVGVFHPATVQTDASPTSELTNAAAGAYVNTVTNTVTGCTFTQGTTLILDQTRSLPNIVTVNVTNPLDCNDSGAAAVVEITVGGTTTYTNPPDDIDTDFDYEWHEGSLPAIISTASNITGLAAGTYFVNVREVNTGCPSSSVEVFVDSVDIVYPVIVIQQTTPQIMCSTLTGSGILAATADGQDDTNGDYTFTWFQNLTTTAPSFGTPSSTITGLFSGDYSVLVSRTSTGCSSSALFVLPNDSINFFPQMALTSNPLTECDMVDGAIFIRGLHFPVTGTPSNNYPFPYNYTADVYVGAPPADINTPEFPNVPHDPNNPGFLENFAQANLGEGVYTVRLVDVNTGCVSFNTVNVENEQVFPKPVITEIAPVTNCLPLGAANGVARALVDGSFVGYSFEWFEGTIPAGSPIFVGPEYGELQPDPFTYVVRATNLITGCSDSTVTVISNHPVPVPTPDITIVSHMTSCAPVAPNGILTASVRGNTAGYIFNWYDGTVVPPLPTPDFVGLFYDSLNIGTYSVSAIDRITGCISPVVSEEILPRPEYPDIDFNLVRAVCGQNNGSITLIITSDVAIDSIIWYNGFGTPDGNEIAGTEGPNLSEALAGDYSVMVNTILGCRAEKDILLDTEIHPYNGISRASTPGQNDYFHIDCIDNFPENVVKIYNRAGTLVYEGHGYDNFDTYFDGKSNKGVSPMGTSLPDGTYFYIIDKRNGSKPLAGYLEIVE